MRGKIDIVFGVNSSFSVDPRVTTRAVLRKKGSTSGKGGCLNIAPRYDFKRFETVQLICARHNKLDELDRALEERSGRGSVVLKDVPCEYISAVSQKGEPYKAIVVNFGTEEAPHYRWFYVNEVIEELMAKDFKTKYTFDPATISYGDPDDELEEDDE